MTFDAWMTLGVLLVAVVLLALDRFNPMLIMGGAVLGLFLAGVIDERQVLGGFANESLAIVAALYVVAGAVDSTGAFEGFTSRLLGNGAPSQFHRDMWRV